MRILHYFLGFPPYRTGGLTKYAFDLMQAQVEDDHIVIALWPGQIGIFNHRVDIKKRDDISGIKNYELINPLPVSLDEGISELEAYMKPCDIATYESFLKDVKPNAIHIHTLMGLHKEFIEAAEKLHIKTVFTTHDYFGICPKVTLYRFGEACQNDHDCRDCIQCNCSALSLKKIMIMQSPLYRGLKNFPIVKQLRKQHRGDFFANELIPEMPDSSDKIAEMAIQYKKLRAYYISMLERIDCIHFNSSVAEAVYKKYMIPKNSVVMTITHKNIVDNRKINEWKPADKFRITSLAPAKPFKGFNVLQTALDELWESGRHDFELKLFSPVKSPRPYMVIKEDGFKQNEILSLSFLYPSGKIFYRFLLIGNDKFLKRIDLSDCLLNLPAETHYGHLQLSHLSHEAESLLIFLQCDLRKHAGTFRGEERTFPAEARMHFRQRHTHHFALAQLDLTCDADGTRKVTKPETAHMHDCILKSPLSLFKRFLHPVLVVHSLIDKGEQLTDQNASFLVQKLIAEL